MKWGQETCTHGVERFGKKRRANGTTYNVRYVVPTCTNNAVITRTIDGQIVKRCTVHA